MQTAHIDDEGDIAQDLQRSYSFAWFTGFLCGSTIAGWAMIWMLSIA